MQYLKTSLTGQAKAVISGMGFSSQSYYNAWDILCEKYGRSDVTVNSQFKKLHSSSSVARRFCRHCQICKSDYKCGEHVKSTWIHIKCRIRRRAELNMTATEITVAAEPPRSPTTERKLDPLQRMACLQSNYL